MSAATLSKTEEELLGVVRRALDDVWSQGREDAIAEVYSPDYVRHDPQLPGISGLSGITEIVQVFRYGIPDLKFTLVEDSIVVGEDKVGAQYIIEGTQSRRLQSIAPTNRQFMVHGQGIWRIRDGKIVDDWQCFDNMNFYQAIGALPGIGEKLENKKS